MGLFYREYTLPGPRADVLANLRDSATRERWQILEESYSSLFAFADTGRLAVNRRKVYVSVEDSARGVRVKLAVWGNRTGARYLVRDMLVFTWLESSTVAEPSHATSGPSGSSFLGHFRNDKPAWVWLTYVGYLLLLVMMAFTIIALAVGKSWVEGRPWLPAVFIVAFFVVALGQQAIEDLLPRFALSIKSRQGIGASLLIPAAFVAVWTLIVLLQHDIL